MILLYRGESPTYRSISAQGETERPLPFNYSAFCPTRRSNVSNEVPQGCATVKAPPLSGFDRSLQERKAVEDAEQIAENS
jgi:hypothetical protein